MSIACPFNIVLTNVAEPSQTLQLEKSRSSLRSPGDGQYYIGDTAYFLAEKESIAHTFSVAL